MRALLVDPRHLQILVLGALLGYGIVVLDFEVRAQGATLIIASALAVQWGFSRGYSGIPFDPRSPLISAMSLALLLRSSEPMVLCAAAGLAIASKFLIRVGDKHVFNPTNLAIVLVVFAGEQAWISPGQWGSGPLGAAALVLMGSLILKRARRSDVTIAFLGFWMALLVARSLWLGEPMAIPLHRLQSGGLLLFAFFMLSDPRTTPDSRVGRILYALLIVLVAGFIQFGLFRPHGLMIALVCCAPLVPMVDRLVPGERFKWPGASNQRGSFSLIPSIAAIRFAVYSEWRSPANPRPRRIQ